MRRGVWRHEFRQAGVLAYGALRAAVRRWLALRRLQESQTFRELEPEDQAEVRRQSREKEDEVEGRLFSLYRRLFRPSREGVEEIRVRLKQDGRTLAEAVGEALKEKGILMDSLSPEFLESHFDLRARPVSLAEVTSALTGSTDMPVAEDPKEAVEEAILEGMDRGRFALRVRDRVYRESREVPREALGDPGAALVPREETVQEGPAPTPTRRRLEATSSGQNVYPLRKVLETIQGRGDVTVRLILEGPLDNLEKELERLLQDSSISHTWEADAP